MDTGSYILRNLIQDVPLSAEGGDADIRITCVEFWNNNLYIGTSAAELLHFVQITPDPSDANAPTFILASRPPVPFSQASNDGIQQILLLPKVAKACVVCNNSLTFFTLPEFSPAFPRMKPLPCVWVGGVDQDVEEEEGDARDGVVVMLCQRNKIRLVKVTDEPLNVRGIEFGGCLAAARRGPFSCVADGNSYALLDVVHQQKIPLFPISSLYIPGDNTQLETPASTSRSPSRSVSSATGPRLAPPFERGHGRSTSLGIFSNVERPVPGRDNPRPTSSQRHAFDIPESFARLQPPRPESPRPAFSPERSNTPQPGASSSSSTDKPLPPAPSDGPDSQRTSQESRRSTPLKPFVTSPSSNEFLLTTGTLPSEPGLGIVVNLEGEVVRGTIQFASYPEGVVVDGKGVDLTASLGAGEVPEEGFILAVMRREIKDTVEMGLEIQRWDIDSGEDAANKDWLNLDCLHGESTPEGMGSSTYVCPGIRTIVTPTELTIPEISNKLALKRLHLEALGGATVGDDSNSTEAQPIPVVQPSDFAREKEELDVMNRLCKVKTSIVIWSRSSVWWTVRNPMVVRLDAQLTHAQSTSARTIEPDREGVERVIIDIRDQQSRTELEFFSLSYIRQKAAALLFMDLVIRTAAGTIIFEHQKRATEKALIESELDPRIVLAFLPILRGEISEGSRGIWVQGGLKETVETFLAEQDISQMSTDPTGPFGDNLLQLIKRYLQFWRQKKGFGSIADGKDIFSTVDAALLHILLILDQQSPPGPATAGSTRAEVNAVVDGGVDCFDRAVELLEKFNRLYMLSRLYQSKKNASKVLHTWKRIVEGEIDEGGEFTDGENELRKYLSKLRDAKLVGEYGTWLAERNPKLGVQVFADDMSRVRFTPPEALTILQESAPHAVKEYLEHLVFGKKQTQYANDLIRYYLDIVLHELTTSTDSRNNLLDTYITYRALRPPKPTYRQFITENAIEAEWWQSRLRLLQLLGSNQGEASSYDVGNILGQLKPYEQELVPEMIILSGKQGRHEDAIRLLVNGLGDYDTAITYCLLGGLSFLSPDDGGPRQRISKDEQAGLFEVLFLEFLRIADISDRIERTGELLERFGGWFDVEDVLSAIPDDWAIDLFSSFIINALRRLIAERSETMIAKALSSSQNLRASAELIDTIDEIGPKIERVS